MKKIIFICCILVSGAIVSLNAQSTPKAHVRQRTQQARIAEGAQNGNLSKKEVRQLEIQQRHIRKSQRRAKADGVVTPQEKREIDRKQNRASRNIVREKRD
jgi:hypothetical protein